MFIKNKYNGFHKIYGSTTVFKIDNNEKKKCFLSSKSAWMISEGSCDIEDWRNDAENSALTSQE